MAGRLDPKGTKRRSSESAGCRCRHGRVKEQARVTTAYWQAAQVEPAHEAWLASPDALQQSLDPLHRASQ